MEARQQQAARIRALCPWKRATGPRTEVGKAKSSRNAWKGGVRADLAHYGKVLRLIGANTQKLFSSFGRKPVPDEAPFLGLDFGLPPNPETDDLPIEELTAMAKRMMAGGGPFGGGLFSSFR